MKDNEKPKYSTGERSCIIESIFKFLLIVLMPICTMVDSVEFINYFGGSWMKIEEKIKYFIIIILIMTLIEYIKILINQLF